MRYVVLVAGLLLTLVGIKAALAKGGDTERPRCEYCGMFTDISTTHSVASIALDGKTANHEFESLGCVFNKLEEWGKRAALKAIKVLDYSSAGSETQKFVNVADAWFLYDTSKLKGSMPPFVAAFSTKTAAEKARAELGGTLMQWDALKPKLLAATKD